jgi:hypothetical protein
MPRRPGRGGLIGARDCFVEIGELDGGEHRQISSRAVSGVTPSNRRLGK